MSNLEIKLKKGLRLRNPIDATLLESGVVYTVPNDKFWRKRIKTGDVYLTQEVVQETNNNNMVSTSKKPLLVESK